MHVYLTQELVVVYTAVLLSGRQSLDQQATSTEITFLFGTLITTMLNHSVILAVLVDGRLQLLNSTTAIKLFVVSV